MEQTKILSGKHIVLIEDSPDVLSLERRILTSRSGAQVHAFDNPAIAYQYLAAPTLAVDAIATDIVLGHVNGLIYLNKMLSECRWTPTVIVSGSHSGQQLLSLFEQGYAVDGNDIPLAMVRKNPSNFAENLIQRLARVIKEGETANYELVGRSLEMVRLAAAEDGVYKVCSGAVDRYFSIAALIAHDLSLMKTEEGEQFNQRATELLDYLDKSRLSYNAFIGQPVIEVHKAAKDLSIILFKLKTLSQIASERVGHYFSNRRRINFLCEEINNLGAYLRELRDTEVVATTRQRYDNDDVIHRQMPPGYWHRIDSGKDMPRRPQPFDDFTGEYTKSSVHRILLASEDAGGYTDSPLSEEIFGKLDIAGDFDQAVNAISCNEYDLVLIHPRLNANKGYYLSEYNKKRYTETIRLSNYPEDLTEDGKNFLSRAQEKLGRRVDKLWFPGNSLAFLIRAMYPNTVIATFTPWDQEDVMFNTGLTEDQLPYHYYPKFRSIFSDDGVVIDKMIRRESLAE